MVSIQIEQIHPALTWRIRQEAMYPDLPLSTVKLDNDLEGIHFGLYADDQLTTVISIFEEGDVCQFRKFATLPEAQRKGYGKLLLQHIISYVKEHGAHQLWCNARVNVAPFYAQFGFRETNERYFKNGYDFVIMDLEL
ncbi:GNAT family N-acetyltransferase [Pedobacter sp.]|uniref:GNAT family N-acetyltransferase n=1 Tax=Pedobacter sp. TaxID=1411316 RepID=UPI003D7FCB82